MFNDAPARPVAFGIRFVDCPGPRLVVVARPAKHDVAQRLAQRLQELFCPGGVGEVSNVFIHAVFFIRDTMI